MKAVLAIMIVSYSAFAALLVGPIEDCDKTAMNSLANIVSLKQFTDQPVETNQVKVYATKYGKKYHKKDCSAIKNRTVTEMTVDEAKKKNLTPCKRCKP